MPDPRAPRRILIVRPSALGDVCRTVPVLVSLRRAWPQTPIDWVVSDACAAAIEAHPCLHEVVRFPRSRLAACWRHPGIAVEAVQWFRSLRDRGYDLVIDCQGLGRSGLITGATRARTRVGFRRAREMAALAYNVKVNGAAHIHTVDAMLSLVAALGVEPVADLRLHVRDADELWWTERRAHLGLDAYVVLAPTARWASKRWPAERWMALADALLADDPAQRIVLVGAPGEEVQVAGFAAERSGVIDFVGHATIGQTMAVIAASRAVVAHDSAPLHMAVGFDRPCVGLFGPTDPAIVGPYGRPEAVVLAPGTRPALSYRDRRTDDALMRRITIDDVRERLASVTMGGAHAVAPSRMEQVS